MANISLSARPFPALPGVHSGTGIINGSAWIADPATVDQDVNTPMGFKCPGYNIQVLSLETDAPEPPNWFGVSFRSGITSFNTVNIFCHPHPGHAGMAPADYASRSGQWPRLFRYVEILGRQMSMANSNIITIVPFFTDGTYGSLGIFAENWVDLVEQIIVHVRNARAGSLVTSAAPRTPITEVERLILESATRKRGAPPPTKLSSNLLRNVVLSDFSRGRQLATNVRSRARGINSFLREAWDFDGTGGSAVAPRVLNYDQQETRVRVKDHFHVPGVRWVSYHKKVLTRQELHGDLPAMLACHAATVSSVGK